VTGKDVNREDAIDLRRANFRKKNDSQQAVADALHATPETPRSHSRNLLSHNQLNRGFYLPINRHFRTFHW
jgi:hypothetical protein